MHYSSNAFSLSPWKDTISAKTKLVDGMFGNYEMMTSIDSHQVSHEPGLGKFLSVSKHFALLFPTLP